MNIDSMISFSELSYDKPLTDFSDMYKKNYPDRMAMITEHPDKIKVITGTGFEVSWVTPHDCGCDRCNHDEDEHEKFFYNKKEAEKYISDLESDCDNDEIEISDGIFFIKAVKQQPVKGGLFNA